MVDGKRALEAAARYIAGHPDEIGRIVRSSFGLRFGFPLAAFRWLSEQVVGDLPLSSPKFEARPPGLRFSGVIEKLGTRIQVSATLYVQHLAVDAEEVRFHLRIDDVALTVLNPEKTILGALVRSGTIDLSRPGDLIRELPEVPAMVLKAEGNEIILDLLQSPRLSQSRSMRQMLSLVSSLVSVNHIGTEADRLDIQLKALPKGADAALGAISTQLLSPGWSRFRRRLGRDSEADELGFDPADAR